jgi:hypothetical protein
LVGGRLGRIVIAILPGMIVGLFHNCLLFENAKCRMINAKCFAGTEECAFVGADEGEIGLTPSSVTT